jgi:hypothetical protein
MGMGKSSGSQQAVVTPEQSRLLNAQTNALEGTFLPAYQKTIGQAQDVYGQTAPAAIQAANEASNVASQTGNLQQALGTAGSLGGMAGLVSLFGPQYKEQQVNAALQAGRESGREAVNQQVAGYGGAGGLGSSRAALANANLASLQEQRQGTVAAQTAAGVEANRASAANALLNAGQTGLSSANQAAAARVGYAQTPQDVLAKYAQVIYGTPQASTTPSFQGTQGQTTSGKSSGFKL